VYRAKTNWLWPAGKSVDRWIAELLDRGNRYCNWRDISCGDHCPRRRS